MKNQNPFNLLFPLNAEQLNYFNKLDSSCTDIQRAWLSGYFWHSANKKSNNFTTDINKKNANDTLITIISASQTGNAKLLSERLYKYLKKNNKKSRLINAFDYKFKKIQDEKILILIISTQGEGEPPEEALSLYKFIVSKKAPNLNNLYYSIFGLGDKSYNFFCQAGKIFDNRFQELGATPLLNRFDADIEYEDDYNHWSKDLLKSINNIQNSQSCDTFSNKTSSSVILKTNFSKKNPATGVILTNQKITGRYSNKDVHHIEIDIKDLNITYQPGDAIGIWYENDINLVKKIIQLFSIDLSELVKIKNQVITIFDALKNHVELTNNTKNIVKNYANITQNTILKKIVSNESSLQNYVLETPFVKMIHDHPQKISSRQLLSFLRPLTPRLYSISSSQEETPNEIHMTVGVIKKIISDCVYLGGASGYLSQSLQVDDTVKFFIETNNNFRLPENSNLPIIMISTGTGIAPFRSFIQQRDNDGSTGKNWIFFGNTNFTEDFLYQLEWQEYIKKGLITNMHVVWSRDQENKLYVQDKMRENSKEIWSWIQEGAIIYICGNATKMAKDVEKALLDIISENGKMNLDNADEFLNNLRLNKRYKRDVY
ncbi:assimilatory sulfite reductase (NADPH) flavoprotein subunit [Buchnera aphidicola]|uniref:Sulfite reductase [NADPH] flavoprotein alpha-component n=1 Tax=Buchnera aphidicola subsp. Uroleucon sonchi TaxID=118118 RepID=A0A6C1FHZ0_BUCUN|nr:assimilatory sulfite reductase (NADPH) flavoprotein subunit [Buchnera aphidicola]QIE02119.1 assimilatory sulfite reductase (NADPH) flavoprotein subunit [Buchnera aphidicola (Uroleucon sonchi)]